MKRLRIEIAALALLFAAIAQAAMVKEVAFGLFADAPDDLTAENFYQHTHGPQIVRLSGPWLRRYVAYRSLPAGAGIDAALGLRHGLYGELWFDSPEAYQTRPAPEGLSTPPWLAPDQHGDADKVLMLVNAAPDHLFVPATAAVMEQPAVRWVTMMEYPTGVSRAAGDAWFLQTHAPEAAKQPGLLRFVCYEKGFAASKGEHGDWVRVCEYWYGDVAAFRAAVIEHPPHYTPPPWGGHYPFVHLASVLLDTQAPDIDFLSTAR